MKTPTRSFSLALFIVPCVLLAATFDSAQAQTLLFEDDFKVVTWGSGNKGQNGSPGTGFIQVAGGYQHSIALRSDGSIFSWGWNRNKQVWGTPSGIGFIQIAAGGYHSVALRSTGSIVSWGRNSKNAPTVANTPTGQGFVQVSAGEKHSLALRYDGSLVSWGRNNWGQISKTPSGGGYVQIASGGEHSLALHSDGSIAAWGYMNTAPPGTDFIQVAGGKTHSVALRADGSIVSWGNDSAGQVSNTPPGTGFVQVAAGGYHSLALRTDGSIVSWGWNNWGQISNAPPGTGFVQVAAGGFHSLVLKPYGDCNVVFCDTDGDNQGDVTLSTCDCSGGSITLDLSTSFTGQYTYPLVGLGTTAVSPTGVSELCLAGSAIGRYSKDAGAISSSGSFSVDLLNANSAPGGGVPTIGGSLCSGNTWRFQYWHRDGMNPSRFSKGISGLIN